jgi:putative transposase
MIDRANALPVTRQARELGIGRGSVYYLPRPVPASDLAFMRRIDDLHMDFPFAGSRMLRDLLAAEGIKVGRLHVSTLMKKMGLAAIYRRPNTSKRGSRTVFAESNGSRDGRNPSFLSSRMIASVGIPTA